mmetsp:Transcript_73825/g.159680  ORF Transcript_73825/g.159680 Transcript_73825/m.159680 type:complete len:249 (-) Transcript_73825:355-1101(-)
MVVHRILPHILPALAVFRLRDLRERRGRSVLLEDHRAPRRARGFRDLQHGGLGPCNAPLEARQPRRQRLADLVALVGRGAVDLAHLLGGVFLGELICLLLLQEVDKKEAAVLLLLGVLRDEEEVVLPLHALVQELERLILRDVGRDVLHHNHGLRRGAGERGAQRNSRHSRLLGRRRRSRVGTRRVHHAEGRVATHVARGRRRHCCLPTLLLAGGHEILEADLFPRVVVEERLPLGPLVELLDELLVP